MCTRVTVLRTMLMEVNKVEGTKLMEIVLYVLENSILRQQVKYILKYKYLLCNFGNYCDFIHLIYIYIYISKYCLNLKSYNGNIKIIFIKTGAVLIFRKFNLGKIIFNMIYYEKTIYIKCFIFFIFQVLQVRLQIETCTNTVKL